jgi:hypothetical protein
MLTFSVSAMSTYKLQNNNLLKLWIRNSKRFYGHKQRNNLKYYIYLSMPIIQSGIAAIYTWNRPLSTIKPYSWFVTWRIRYCREVSSLKCRISSKDGCFIVSPPWGKWVHGKIWLERKYWGHNSAIVRDTDNIQNKVSFRTQPLKWTMSYLSAINARWVTWMREIYPHSSTTEEKFDEKWAR